jgi:outer membrane protein assembly factor BamB
MIYLTDYEGTSYALQSDTGNIDWSLDTQTFEPLLVTQDTVYVSGANSQVLAIDRERGEFRWTTQIAQEPPRDEGDQGISTVPLVAGGNVIVGHHWSYGDDERGWNRALNPRCGSERWSITIAQERPKGLATDGETVYTTTTDHLYAVDAEDGTEHWRIKDVQGPPALAGETILVKVGHNIHAFATTDGSERWNTNDRPNVKYSPTVSDGRVFLVEHDPARVYALELTTGETDWEFTMEELYDIVARVTYVSGTLYCLGYFDSPKFRILALDATTGEIQTEAALPRKTRAETKLENVTELAVTAEGIFTHSHYSEGGRPETIYRFTPE